MKLSEIVASLAELKTTVASFLSDKAKATTEALTSFASKLSALETGAVAELTQSQADLATAKQSLASLEEQVKTLSAVESGIKTNLDSAVAALKLDIAPTASHAEKITALQDSVSTTLAKLNVPQDKIPAGKPAAGSASSGKTMTRVQFEALHPEARNEFFRTGGKLKD